MKFAGGVGTEMLAFLISTGKVNGKTALPHAEGEQQHLSLWLLQIPAGMSYLNWISICTVLLMLSLLTWASLMLALGDGKVGKAPTCVWVCLCWILSAPWVASKPVCLTLQVASPTVCLWAYSVCLDVMRHDTWVCEQVASFFSEEKVHDERHRSCSYLVYPTNHHQWFYPIPSPTERKFNFQVLFSISYCSHCNQ